LAWLVDLWRTVYPHKWSIVSYRSSAGQEKFARQRPAFYCCATQPTKDVQLSQRKRAIVNMTQRCPLSGSQKHDRQIKQLPTFVIRLT